MLILNIDFSHGFAKIICIDLIKSDIILSIEPIMVYLCKHITSCHSLEKREKLLHVQAHFVFAITQTPP